MKKIGIIAFVFLVGVSVFANMSATRPMAKKIIMIEKGDDYKELWKEVQKFDDKRLPKSALEIVNQIYEKSKAENNNEQLIKALFYKANYQQSLEEQSFLKTMVTFKEEAEKASFPNQQIIYSIIAEQFWQYYQNNQWQINQRTHTENYDLEDIETWDIRTIIEEATKYYLLSIKDIDKLSRTPLNAFNEIIIKGQDSDKKQTEKYRPYLYDFLAHRAIDFFMNEVPNITQAAETFKIDDEKFFASAQNFSKAKIEVVDSSNLK